mmetsp:Transcript_425/g.1258  ORF Transcript_425/g.1258 Transcript_425/m.1258 type:complete len:363 (+) Transcript_425:109-1197(+)
MARGHGRPLALLHACRREARWWPAGARAPDESKHRQLQRPSAADRWWPAGALPPPAPSLRPTPPLSPPKASASRSASTTTSTTEPLTNYEPDNLVNQHSQTSLPDPLHAADPWASAKDEKDEVMPPSKDHRNLNRDMITSASTRATSPAASATSPTAWESSCEQNVPALNSTDSEKEINTTDAQALSIKSNASKYKKGDTMIYTKSTTLAQARGLSGGHNGNETDEHNTKSFSNNFPTNASDNNHVTCKEGENNYQNKEREEDMGMAADMVLDIVQTTEGPSRVEEVERQLRETLEGLKAEFEPFYRNVKKILDKRKCWVQEALDLWVLGGVLCKCEGGYVPAEMAAPQTTTATRRRRRKRR